MSSASVPAAIARLLADECTGAIFSVPASETMAVVVAAEALGVRVFHCRHEQVAVGMADGYSRTVGAPGVAVVGRGPGFTNGLNALVGAVKARSGVVVLTGELPAALLGDHAARHPFHMKNVDQARIAEVIGCQVVRLASVDTLRADLRRALGMARDGRSVVVLLPSDVAAGEVGDEVGAEVGDEAGDAVGDRGDREPDVRRAAASDLSALADVTALLHETWACRRPVILAGRGASSPSARASLVALGDRIGALLATTLMAKDLFRGEAADVGVLGTLASQEVVDLAIRSDLVLAFGASLHPFTTYGGELVAKTLLVHIDSDPSAFGRFLEPDVAVLGDACTAAQELVDALERSAHRVEGYRTPAVLASLDAWRRGDRARGETPVQGASDRPLDAHGALAALDAVLPADRSVVVDAGAHMPAAAMSLAVQSPDRFITTALDYMSVGSAFGVALGVAAGDPSRVTLHVIGDGGLAMVLGDLSTLVRYRLPVVVAVVNDSAFGQEVQLLQLAGLPDDVARYPTLEFEAIATALGLRALTLTRAGDLDALPSALRSELPALVDIRVQTGALGPHSSLATKLGR